MHTIKAIYLYCSYKQKNNIFQKIIIKFYFGISWRIVGNALIVGDTEDGDFSDTKLSMDEIMEQIRFFDKDEPLPPPRFRVIGL